MDQLLKRNIFIVFLLVSTLLLFGCSSKEVEKPTQTSNTNYELFLKNVLELKNSIRPKGFSLITKGEKDQLNRQLTTFLDNQHLDPRKFDGVDGDANKPSKFEYFFLNEEQSILVRLDLMYCPEFTSTRIIASNNLEEGYLPFVEEKESKLVNISYLTYLISFKSGLAQVDFILLDNPKTRLITKKTVYIIDKGLIPFFPSLEKSLLNTSKLNTSKS